MNPEFESAEFKKCLHKMIEMLSRRDHSPQELFQKLNQKDFDPEIIEKVLLWGAEKKYIRPLKEQSQILYESLLRRGKGRNFIQMYLKRRGLPPIETHESDTEMRKALEFALKKAKTHDTLDRNTLEKIGRQLIRRGFPLEIVRKVIYEKLKSHKEF